VSESTASHRASSFVSLLPCLQGLTGISQSQAPTSVPSAGNPHPAAAVQHAAAQLPCVTIYSCQLTPLWVHGEAVTTVKAPRTLPHHSTQPTGSPSSSHAGIMRFRKRLLQFQHSNLYRHRKKKHKAIHKSGLWLSQKRSAKR